MKNNEEIGDYNEYFQPTIAHLSNGMVLRYNNGKWFDIDDGKEVKLYIETE